MSLKYSQSTKNKGIYGADGEVGAYFKFFVVLCNLYISPKDQYKCMLSCNL